MPHTIWLEAQRRLREELADKVYETWIEPLRALRCADGVLTVEVASAFDVNDEKVGCDVAEAIHAPPNNTRVFAEVPRLGVRVQRGPTLDGIGEFLREHVCAIWIGPNICDRKQSLVALRAAMTRIAIRREQGRSSFRRLVIDFKWITRRPDFLR